jgi:negative regulator of sigma E activity
MTTGPDQNPLIDEQLSAWLDDELPRAEQELLVTRLAQSTDYQARVARYSLIGSSLRGLPVGDVASEVAALKLGGRVRAALDGPMDARQEPVPRPLHRVLPYAMAAGLALVAVLLAIEQGPLRRPIGAPVQALAQPVASASASVRQAALSSQRMTNYLVFHGQFSGPLSARVTESHIVTGGPYSVAVRTTDRSVAR